MLLNLCATFGVPTAIASSVCWYLEMGSAAATIIGILGAVATGGLACAAEAGAAGIVAYLKKQLIKMGKKRFIMW